MDLENRGYWRWTKRIGGTAVLFVGMMASSGAVAGDSVAVKTPLGKTINAEKVTNPAKGTIEHQILESLKQIRDGKFSDWRKSHCFPARCDTDIAWEQMKAHNLPESQKTAAYCLQGDNKDEIWVTSRKGDVKTDEVVKVFIFCGAKRMPSPSTHQKFNNKWYVQQFSW